MRFGRSSDLGRAITDRRPTGDHGRQGGFLLRQFNGREDCILIVPVYGLNVPAGGFEARALIFGSGNVGFAVNGDFVVIPQNDQLAQLQVTSQGDRFLTNPFHQAAVACDHVCIVIDQLASKTRGKPLFSHGETNGIGDALPQRPSGGLDAFGVAILRVSRCLGPHLAEVLDFFERDIFVPGQIQRRVEEHRAVACGQDETITVRPLWPGGIVLQYVAEQDRGDVSHTHWHAGVA